VALVANRSERMSCRGLPSAVTRDGRRLVKWRNPVIRQRQRRPARPGSPVEIARRFERARVRETAASICAANRYLASVDGACPRLSEQAQGRGIERAGKHRDQSNAFSAQTEVANSRRQEEDREKANDSAHQSLVMCTIGSRSREAHVHRHVGRATRSTSSVLQVKMN